MTWAFIRRFTIVLSWQPLEILLPMQPLEFCLSSSSPRNTTSLLREISCPYSPPHLFVYFCLFPHLDITSESVKGFRREVLVI